jgi:hypothetical protein
MQNFRDLVDKLLVRCGDWDSQTELEDLPHQEQDVEAIQVMGLHDSIALISHHLLLIIHLDLDTSPLQC